MSSAAFLPVIVLLIIFLVFLGMAISAFMLIANWKLFVKCHRKGWESIVPYYNTYIMCKVSGSKMMWGIILMVAPFVMGIISNAFDIFGSIFQSSDFMIGLIAIVGGLVSLVAIVIMYIASFIIYINLAKRFGKSTGFGVGLVLLPIVFIPILAFGKAEYQVTPVNN